MAIKNLHSTTTQALPHMLPGEIAVNLADDVIWMRCEGVRTPIKLADVRARAPSSLAQPGTPLVSVAAGKSEWDAALAPSSLVNDRIQVDYPPPTGQYAIPGLMITGLGADRPLLANAVEVSSFYVASDQIDLLALTFAVRSAAPPAIRVGIVDALGVILTDTLISAPVVGANVVNLGGLSLARGTYRTVIGVINNVTLGSVQALRPQQGWDTVAGAPVFTRSEIGVKDVATGIGSLPTLTPRTSGVPGEDKMVLFRWTFPA